MKETRMNISGILDSIRTISENRYLTPEELEEIEAQLTDVYCRIRTYTKKTPLEKMLIDCFRPSDKAERDLMRAIELQERGGF